MIHDLLGLLGPFLVFVAISPIDVLVRYLQITFLLLLLLSVLNLEVVIIVVSDLDLSDFASPEMNGMSHELLIML